LNLPLRGSVDILTTDVEPHGSRIKSFVYGPDNTIGIDPRGSRFPSLSESDSLVNEPDIEAPIVKRSPLIVRRGVVVKLKV